MSAAFTLLPSIFSRETKLALNYRQQRRCPCVGQGWGGGLGVPACLPVQAQLQYNLILFPLPGQVTLGYWELLAQEVLCVLIESGEILQPLMWARS